MELLLKFSKVQHEECLGPVRQWLPCCTDLPPAPGDALRVSYTQLSECPCRFLMHHVLPCLSGSLLCALQVREMRLSQMN